MRTISFAALIGTASAGNVDCKMTANDKITAVKWGSGSSWTTLNPTKHSSRTDEKFWSTTYSFNDHPNKELKIKVEDKSAGGNNEKSGAFSMKCTSTKTGSSWHQFKSNINECWDPNNVQAPLCQTNKAVSFDGRDKRNNVAKEFKIWHCDQNQATSVMKCKPEPAPTAPPTESPTKSPTESPTKSPTESPTKSPTASPTASPTKSPTESPTKSPTESPTKSPTVSPTTSPTASPTTSPTASPTASPTTSPTASPTASPTDECDVANCGNWVCAQWCKCYTMNPVELYAENGCVEDGEETCFCRGEKEIFSDYSA